MEPKFPKYQDYVIKDGKLVGEFEEMYKDHQDPWHQTTREEFASEKAAGLNLISRLKKTYNIHRVVELGCGFGNYTARIHQLGLDTTGLDISETAIRKATERHASNISPDGSKITFEVATFDEFEKLKTLKPDLIVMPEITWYVLDKLNDFKAFLKNELPGTFLLHMLMTYEPGVQVYGREFFTNLDEILAYFNMQYLEAGSVRIQTGGARTWFLGTWHERIRNEWLAD